MISIDKCEGELVRLAGRSGVLIASRATLAIYAAMRALQLPAGSEVLMPANLCANPAEAVRLAGLKPLFVDISAETLNIDWEAAEPAVGPRTRVLLAVPIFGQPLDMPNVLHFAEHHNLTIMEDAAQALGVRHGKQPAGSVGICSVFSFGQGKIGDAGGGAALLSDDMALLERAQVVLAAMPSASSLQGLHERIYRSLQALPGEIEARTRLAEQYRQRLDMPGVTHPGIAAMPPLWKYSVLLASRHERDAVTWALLALGVEATNLYLPLSLFEKSRLKRPGGYTAGWSVYNRIVNLPLWPQPAHLLERVLEGINAGLNS